MSKNIELIRSNNYIDEITGNVTSVETKRTSLTNSYIVNFKTDSDNNATATLITEHDVLLTDKINTHGREFEIADVTAVLNEKTDAVLYKVQLND